MAADGRLFISSFTWPKRPAVTKPVMFREAPAPMSTVRFCIFSHRALKARSSWRIPSSLCFASAVLLRRASQFSCPRNRKHGSNRSPFRSAAGSGPVSRKIFKLGHGSEAAGAIGGGESGVDGAVQPQPCRGPDLRQPYRTSRAACTR